MGCEETGKEIRFLALLLTWRENYVGEFDDFPGVFIWALIG